MNAQAAIQCFRHAQALLSKGNDVKARRFAERALRLDSSLSRQVQAFLERIDSSSPCATPPSPPPSPPSPSPSRSRPNARSSSPSPEQSTEPDFTPAQKTAVEHILKNKDYYKILSISRDSPQSQVKRAYKKTAMRVHPDVNHHPGATEAFKKVSQAFLCLSSEEKRAIYDENGLDVDDKTEVHRRNDEEMRRRYGRRGHPQFAFRRNGMAGDPFFDLFSQMFGNDDEWVRVSRGGRTVRMRRGRPFNPFFGAFGQDQENGGQRRRAGSLIFGLCLFVFVFILLSGMMSGASGFGNPHSEWRAMFSFKRTDGHRTRRLTRGDQIAYYVGPEYRTYHRDRVEQYVRTDYQPILRRKCQEEQELKQEHLWKIRNARGGQKAEFRKEYEQFEMPNCEKYSRLYRF